MEENNDRVEEEEEPEDEQEKEEVSSSLEEEGEVEDGKTDYDLWCPLLGQVGPDLKELYMKEVQQFLAGGGGGGNPKPILCMLLSMPYYLYVEEGCTGLS